MSMSGPFKIGDWLVRPEMNSLERAEKVVKVEPRYMDLLVYLAQRQGEVVGADDIHEHVWAGVVVGDHAVYQAIARLRKALGDHPGKPFYIETVPKRGYRLLQPALPVEQGETAPAVDKTPRKDTAGENGGGSSFAGRRMLIWSGVIVALAVVVTTILWATLRDRDRVTGDDQTLAVLPFQMHDPQSREAYLAYGLTVDLINQLGKIQDLKVLGQLSTGRFKGADQDVREIGRRLAVDMLVLGKARIASGRLQVDIELLDAHSGARVWSERFDRLSGDIFSLQDEVAERVAAALGKRYVPGQAPYRQTPKETILDAYDFYLLGRFYEKDRNRKSLERALEMYRKAIDTAPEFPGGHRGVASVSLLLTYYGELPLSQAEGIALSHLERALQLHPGDAENYGTMGLARYLQGEYGLAEEMLKRALAINGNYAMAWMWLGMTLEMEGNLQQAVAYYRHAARLEPLSVVVNSNLAEAQQYTGQQEAAGSGLDTIEDSGSSSVQYNRVRADLLQQRGELAAAYRHARRALELDYDDAMAMAQLALVLQDLGQQEAQQKLFDQILDRGLNGKAGALLIMKRIYLRLDRSARSRADRMIAGLFFDDQRIAQINWRRRAAFRGLSAADAGRYDEAVEQLESAWRGGTYAIVSTDFDLLYCTALAFSQQARGRERAGADALAACEDRLQRVQEQGWDSQWTAYAAVQMAVLSGRHEEATTGLETLYDRGFNGTGLLQNDPLLEAIRQRPGFLALIEKMKQRAAAAWAEIAAEGRPENGASVSSNDN